MKIRIHRIHLARTLNYYGEQLAIKFGPLALNEAVRELIRIEANQLQQKMARVEKSNSWQIPIRVDFSSNGQYNVLPLDENNILIID